MATAVVLTTQTLIMKQGLEEENEELKTKVKYISDERKWEQVRTPFNRRLNVNRGRRQMRERLAGVAWAVTVLGSSSLHPSPSPPASPAGHQREEEWPVLESSGGGRCPTGRQHTPVWARLLPNTSYSGRANERELSGASGFNLRSGPNQTSEEKDRG